MRVRQVVAFAGAVEAAGCAQPEESLPGEAAGPDGTSGEQPSEATGEAVGGEGNDDP